MGINPRDFREFIVDPVCDMLAHKASVPDPLFIRDLIVATAAQETAIGTHLHQTGAGPAISIYQFEKPTLDDVWRNFVTGNARFKSAVDAVMVPGILPVDQIMWNLGFATLMCRLMYYRVKEPLPPGPTTFDGMWHYYKKYWNSDLGAATPESFHAALRLTDIHV